MILAVGVAVVAVPEGALEALSAFEQPPVRQIAPLLAVALSSVADAYVLARMNNARTETPTTDADDAVRCPSCGRETDVDLEFCHWCSEPLPTRRSIGTGRSDDRR